MEVTLDSNKTMQVSNTSHDTEMGDMMVKISAMEITESEPIHNKEVTMSDSGGHDSEVKMRNSDVDSNINEVETTEIVEREDVDMSDDESCCPSEFGVSDDDEMDDSPAWDEDTFDQNHGKSLQKLEGPPMFIPGWKRLSVELQGKILSYLTPEDYCWNDPSERLWNENTQYGRRLVGPAGNPQGPLLPIAWTPNISLQAFLAIANEEPVIPHEKGCKCSLHLRPYRNDHTPLAPQMLVLNKENNKNLTQFYFEKCSFPALIEFQSFGALPPVDISSTMMAAADAALGSPMALGTPMTLGFPLNVANYYNGNSHSIFTPRFPQPRKPPADPVMRWHRVEIVPGKEYPLSFNSIKTLNLYIQLNKENMRHLRQYKNGLCHLAQIFAPNQAPAALNKLILKIYLQQGVYEYLKGCREDHVSPRNIVGHLKELIEPFYIFSGEGNGTVKSIREEGEGMIDPTMDDRYQLAGRMGNTGIKKTVEVDVLIHQDDGTDGEDDGT